MEKVQKLQRKLNRLEMLNFASLHCHFPSPVPPNSVPWRRHFKDLSPLTAPDPFPSTSGNGYITAAQTDTSALSTTVVDGGKLAHPFLQRLRFWF